MQQPFSNSEAVKRCMNMPDLPLSGQIRYGPRPPYATNSNKPRQRPYSAPARRLTGGHAEPWRSSTYQEPRIPIPRHYHVTLNHRSDETDFSRNAPYAPRKMESIFGRNGDVRSSIPLPPYSPLNDPHLTEYFERRFGAIQAAAASKQRRLLYRRPSSATGSYAGRSSKRKKDEDTLYKVAVITGDKKNAGTDAKVFLTIKGLKGKIPKTRLTKKAGSVKSTKKVAFRFAKGSTHLFKIRGPEIGEIRSIVVEHDGVQKDQAWFLQEVEIIHVKKKKSWSFICNQWLSLHHGDQHTSRELFPQMASKTEYEIVTVTGDKQGAATNANVYITIFGKTGATSKLPLKDHTKKNFRLNSSDSFKVRTNCVGPMRKIRIEHDNTGMGAGWYLERVVITDLQHPKWKYYFPCGQWLARDEGDGSICRYLIGSKDPFAIRKDSQYKVSVYTGDKKGAGTDANVCITLFGENGDSGEMKLDNSKNNFERNDVDEFMLRCPCLGRIERLRIGHDNSGFGPGWYLEKVIVDDCDNNIVYEFPCQRWLARDMDDGQIWRDLLVNVGPTAAAPGIPYVITVQTGDEINAGTGARVFIMLYGGKNKEDCSGKIWLDNGKFERDRTDIFNIDIAALLSPLEKIEIGHDNSGIGPGWFLEQVIVYCPTTGIEQYFPCRKWFATDSGDKQIQRTLFEQTAVRKKREKRITWYVWVHTSDTSLAGTDAKVFMCVYGEKGKSEEIRLSNKGDEFESGNIDTFKLDLPDVGNIYKVRMYHDNSGLAAGWHLNKVEMECMGTKDRYFFNCNRWLAEDEDDKAIVREIAAEGKLIKRPLPLVKYQVEVYTGKKSGAGTDANVFLTIFGELGDTGRRFLRHSSTNINKFEKGQCDMFEIEAVTLEKISKIQIGHDGKGIGAGWYLDKVVIKNPSQPKHNVTFECFCWLAEDEGTGEIVKEFTVSGSQMLGKTTYNVHVKTGDERYSGTDANVYLQIYGSKGDTGELHLRQSENHSNKFERGKTDHFKLEATDIGKIKKIKIGHDGKNPGSGWFLDEVRIDIPSRGEQYVFACHRWLDKDEGDGLIELELEPSWKEDREKTIPYEVTVWTGDKRGAGTDARVFLQIYGKDGKTEDIELDNKSDNFERNKVDKFKIEGKDVGQIVKIRIGHDGTSMGDGWYLDKLLIQRKPRKPTKKQKGKKRPPSALERRQSILADKMQSDSLDSDGSTSSSPTPRRRKSLKRRPSDLSAVKEESEEEEAYDEQDETEDYWFFVDKWFAKSEGDKQIVRELIPTDKDGRPLKGALDDVEYIVRVYTGTVSGAGTDANVFITLYGKTDSGERQLKESNKFNKFENGQEDIFKVQAKELGPLTKVRIRHDNTGLLGAAWFLDRIEVEDTKKKKTYYFLCQRWLATGEDDGQICRELVAVDKALITKMANSKDAARKEVALETKAAMTTYHVKVVTGDVFGAGTDANVFLRLFGDQDNTEKIPLKSSLTYKDKFERNHTDEFILEVVNIGELSKVNISHDNSGAFGADWFLEKVIIDSPSLGKTWTFPCGRWLSKSKDDGKIERDLFPQELETEEYIPCIPYEIKVLTSEKSGADTSADVYIQIYGKETCTQQKSLCTGKNERSGKFKKGASDVFVLELEDVGEITKIRIGHDNAGLFAGWHLDKVEIRKLQESGKGSIMYSFPCNRWLARDEEDKAIERELVPERVTKEVIKDGKIQQKEMKVKNQLELKNYTVNVQTMDVSGAGTDANVFINVYGDKGNSGERKLAKSETYRDKFERGHKDVFKIEARDLGNIYKLKIHHDNKNFGPSWYLDYVEVVDNSDKNQSYMFHCERWLAKNKDDGKIERTLYVKGYEGEMGSSTGTLRSTKYGSVASLDSMKSSDPFSKSPRVSRKQLMQAEEDEENLAHGDPITYNVKVWTGEGEDNGTDSNVWVKIVGPRGIHTGKQFLEFAQKDKFDPGSVKVFSFDAPDVNEVKKIEVGHDGTAPGSDWFLKDISINIPTKGRQYSFNCKQWLGRHKGDGKTVRTFRLDDGLSQITKYKAMVPYEVTIQTGDKPEAGTDMEIYMTVFGAKGSTAPLLMEKGTERFERDRADFIRLELDDIAPLKKIRLEVSGKGSRPQWYLDHIELRNMDTGTLSRFECNDWFGKKKGDGKLVRDVPAKERGKLVINNTTYKISVKTSDVPGAGTNANVYCILFGLNGDSGELHLKKSETNKDPFENNQTDVFTFQAVLSVGELSKCRVWHDNKGFGSAWHLDHIEVEDLGTKKKYLFHCGKWLSKSEDDKQILRELTCANAARPLTPGSKDEVVYDVEVMTDDKSKAGTIHNGWIILKGKKGTGKLKMKNTPRYPILRRGDTNNFNLTCQHLGKLQQVTIGVCEREDQPLQDLEGKEAMWYCLQVSVTDTSTGDKFIFPCKSWIPIGTASFKQKEGKVLELKDVEQSMVSSVRNLATVKYEVVVYTGDVFGAGTNANVCITLFGNNGDTGKRPLEQKWRDLFERNQIDKFELESLDLGEITKVRIEHDNANFRPGWFLDKIEVTNLATSHKTTFPCGQWLDKNKEDGAISRDLMPMD